mmetsp:Transcript_14078/g.35415  ORF Transcript_14078/g.35415 Transcript_14078/m.35415 type:complete len:184 (+) Transcript_14078:160-711(+)
MKVLVAKEVWSTVSGAVSHPNSSSNPRRVSTRVRRSVGAKGIESLLREPAATFEEPIDSILPSPLPGPPPLTLSFSTFRSSVTFHVHKRLPFGQELFVTGDSPALGSWAPTEAKKLTWHGGDAWRVTLDLPAGTAVEYKFLIGIPGPDGKHISHFSWMPGENFRFEVPRRGGTTVEDRWPANQ